MSDLRMELIQGQLNDIEENVRSIKATWGNTIMMLDNIKSSLKGDRQKAIDEAYQKGFEAGSHEATTLEYQQGLDDAWETVRKLYNYWYGNDDIFGDETFCEFIFQHSASEVIDRIKTYEEQQKVDAEIKVGDEVVALRGKAIVLRRYKDKYRNNEDACEYWYYDIGKIDHDATYNLRKTGRHFPQMAELIKAMKEGAE